MLSYLREFSRLFYSITFIPISCYRFEFEHMFSYPESLSKINSANAFSSIIHFSKSPDYFITASYSYFGYIELENSDFYLIIGPVFSTPLTEETLRNFMREGTIPLSLNSQVKTLLTQTPLISYNQLLETLSFIELNLNHKTINLSEHFHLKDTNLKPVLSSKHSQQLYDTKEAQSFHNTYDLELELLRYLQNGDVDKLKQYFQEPLTSLSAGIIADNTLRQNKNIFISSTALATRAAIAGGLDIEQAYQLSDIYIMECEHLNSIEAISNLSYNMMLDFTERVAQQKIPQGMSRDVFDCVQFITRNTNSMIRVDDVAEHVHRSRSYIGKKFKEELGFDISHFIMRCKLEEAKGLLTYSNKSLSEISNYLCFSSQAYFQNVFKKKYGLTPMQYRKKTK